MAVFICGEIVNSDTETALKVDNYKVFSSYGAAIRYLYNLCMSDNWKIFDYDVHETGETVVFQLFHQQYNATCQYIIQEKNILEE